MKFVQPQSVEQQQLREDVVHPLMTRTNAQIDTYVDNNVTNLAEAKALFKQMLRLQRNLLRQVVQLQQR